MRVEKPIFIIGVGRSGSTIFQWMLSEHPNLAWLSKWCDLYPDNGAMNRRLMMAIDVPIFGPLLRRRYPPGECYDFWEYHFRGFSEPCRDLLAEDVTNKVRGRVHRFMSQTLTTRRNRLLVKITGWPRMGFLHELFQDAKFIHILRDGRAVVNSMMNVDWWTGWRGPQNWRWGELTPSEKREWERYNRSFIALAGIEWRILMNAVDEAKRFMDTEDLLEVKYEDLCSNPMVVLKDVAEFCDLGWSRQFENRVKKYRLRNTNHKWQEELSAHQQGVAEDVLRDHLKTRGYV